MRYCVITLDNFRIVYKSLLILKTETDYSKYINHSKQCVYNFTTDL